MRLRGLAAVALVAGICACPAGAAPESNALIRPGVGIGKVRLGMTEGQVRRTLGRPFAVRRRPQGFDRLRVELQFKGGYLFVALSGRRGALRVIGVSTVDSAERTPQGVRVGVTERRVARAYGRRLRCEPLRRRTFQGHVFIVSPRTCSLRGPGGTRTVFISHTRRGWDRDLTAATWPDAATVTEIGVQAAG